MAKNKSKYEKAIQLIDSMKYNPYIKDYELISDVIEREYKDTDSKPKLIGVLQSLSSPDNPPSWRESEQELRIRLKQINLILEMHGDFLMHSDRTWEYIQNQKEQERAELYKQDEII